MKNSRTHTIDQFVSSVIAVALLAFPIAVLADVKQYPVPAGLGLCEDFVHTTDVLASLSSELLEVIQGGEFVIVAALKNQSDIQLVDASLYVKFVALDTGRVIHLSKLEDRISLDAGSEGQFSVSWNVPSDAVIGKYAAEIIILSGERSPVLGSFDPELKGSPLFFNVVGEQIGSAYFLPEKTRINAEHAYSSGKAITKSDGPLTVSIPVNNDSNIPLKATATWRIYSDAVPRGEKLFREINSEVKVHPRSSGEATFLIDDVGGRSFFIEGSIDRGSMRSNVYLRLIRTSIAAPQLLSVGVSEPRQAEGKRSAYACISSEGMTSDGVHLNLKVNRLGIWSFMNLFGPVASVDFEGSVFPHLPYALSAPISSDSQVSVSASLYHGDAFIDETVVPYATPIDYILGAIIPIIVVLLLLLGYFLATRRRF